MKTTWKNKHILKVRDDQAPKEITDLDPEKLRKEIEPWLTALFQSDHLSVMMGAGISSAVHHLATSKAGAGMGQMAISAFKEQVDKTTKVSAKNCGRGEPNIEDQIRVINELVLGLEIYISSGVYGSKKLGKKLNKLKSELKAGLVKFAGAVLQCERNVISSDKNCEATKYLMSFLVSFASRSGTRERLNIFTTNYDRIIELGADLAGIRLIDRFVGSITPIFRSSRLEVDMHYNPPGIRGEPRFLEGVAHFTKLHGSLDWEYKEGYVRRIALPFGAKDFETFSSEGSALMIYPNSSKDRETAEYPYVELFRDLAVSLCRPNSTLFLYGYSFGDEHINRVIQDMLTIPSTHLVIISYRDDGDRIFQFYYKIKRPAQISLLIGDHFGDLKALVDNYLPKPAIDRTTFKMVELLKARGYIKPDDKPKDGTTS